MIPSRKSRPSLLILALISILLGYQSIPPPIVPPRDSHINNFHDQFLGLSQPEIENQMGSPDVQIPHPYNAWIYNGACYSDYYKGKTRVVLIFNPQTHTVEEIYPPRE